MNRHSTTTGASALVFACLIAQTVSAAELHVAVRGKDSNTGSSQSPFRTISAAAAVARPGDSITVHEGTYRERVTPPRGGESDAKRIVYQSAPGEKVEIKGSEVVRSWVQVQNDIWKAVIPNVFFGAFNPYSDTIRGDWFEGLGRRHHTGAVYLNGDWLNEAASKEQVFSTAGALPVWYGEVDSDNTILWAQFKGVNPNTQLVEINVRSTVFYPERTGVNYITVRGFILQQAATNWAPPTAEQVGLIGVHWSKGWIIENNIISHSRCSGVSLGKYGDQWDNTSANSAEGYVKTIERGLANGWNKETVGSHIVRNNVIHDCEQTGVVGSLGAIFSRIENNHIYNIWTRRLFNGAEIGGIKLHGAIDVVIKHNRIHNTCRALWLDWMAQGTRVTENLFYDQIAEDIFVEVNHGPFLIDNNILLSPWNLSDASEGGAYVHNLFAGEVRAWPDAGRETPYHPAHATTVAGLKNLQCGDNRFFNNTFLPPDTANPRESLGLVRYDAFEHPLLTGGNVYYNHARPYGKERAQLVVKGVTPRVVIVEKSDGTYLHCECGEALQRQPTVMISTSTLGKARISGLGYENSDGSPLTVNTDYFGKPRKPDHPTAGPFENPGTGKEEIKVW